VATYAPGSPLTHPSRLVKAADLALYNAKHTGRNCVRVFSFKARANARPQLRHKTRRRIARSVGHTRPKKGAYLFVSCTAFAMNKRSPQPDRIRIDKRSRIDKGSGVND